VTATNVSCGQLTLNWGAAADAAGYEIQVSTASNFSSSIAGNNCGGVACNGSVNVGNVTTASITGLSSGTQYWIRVRARNGSAPCRSGWTNLNTTSVTTTTAPVAPVLTLSSTNICIGDAVSATLQTAGSGGAGCSATYEYRVDGAGWQSYTLGTPITALASYPSIEFRAIWGGCSGLGCASVENRVTCDIYKPPTLSLTGLDATTCNNGSLNLTVSGGTGPFTYNWSGSNGYSSIGGTSKTNLSGATYTATVTDAVCGYTVSDSEVINAPWVADAGPDVTSCSFPVQLNGGYTGTIANVTTTGSSTFTYSGSGNDCNNFFIGGTSSGMPAGAIITSMVVSASIGPNCTSWYELDVFINSVYQGSSCNFTGFIDNSLNGLAANGQIFRIRSWDNNDWCDAVTMGLSVTYNYAYTTPGTATYSWSAGTSNGSITNPTVSAPGTYTLSVTGAGCTVTDQAIIYQPTIPAVPVLSNSGPICSGNTATLTAAGMAPSGQVVNFSTGSYSYVTAPHDASYNITNNSTVEAWIRPTSFTGQQIIFNKENAYEAAIEANGTISWAYNSTTPGWTWINTGFAVPLNQWTHVAFVRDFPSNIMKTYVNGSLVHTNSMTGALATNTNPFLIGNGSFNSPFYGSIDNVRVWNTARITTDLQNNMYLETPLSSIGLVANYPLNGNGNASPGVNGSLVNAGGASYIIPNYYTYTWSGTGAPVASINETQTTSALPSTPSSQNYTVTATAGGCSGTASATNTVTVNPTVALTSVTATATGPLCSSGTTTVTANGVVGSLNWWTGSGGTGTNLGTANPLLNQPPGTYYARVSGTCGGPIENFVTVTLQGNVGTPSFTAGPTSICQDAANSTYTATATNTSGITYSVSPVGAGTINSTTGVMDWSASFSGAAIITASAAGCNGPTTNTRNVTVNPNLAASVSIAATSSIICPSTSVTFTATPTNGGTPSYQWRIGTTNVGINSNTFTTTSLANGDAVTLIMTSNATCATGSPATSNVINMSVISPTAPVKSVTAQPTCATPGGTITISVPLGAVYEYSLNNGAYQSSPTFGGLVPGNYSATTRLIASPTCVSLPSASITVSSTPSALPPMTPVFVCQGGTGSLVSNNNCINNFVIPFVQNSIYFGWSASGDPMASAPVGLLNTSTCSFTGPNRTYSVVQFQVSITGNYIFEMNDNPAYNGVGYIYTGTFAPGSCASGSLVRADNDAGTGNEPLLGGAGGNGPMNLIAGVTYTLVSSTEGVSDVTAFDYTWTITPPVGGNIMLNEPGSVQWYTAATGGSPIYTGQNFNPVGVAGSGLANTNSSGTWTYHAACSSSPSCRTAASFTITNTTTLFNITPGGGATCYNSSTPINVGISGSLNGMVYRLYKDGVYTGTQATGNGSAITVGNTSTDGIYTVVAVIGSTCVIPMTGTVEIKPVPIANAGLDITLCTPNPPSIILSGSSNPTSWAFEDFGNVIDVELTNTTSDWRIHYLYNNHPANRTEWHIGNATGSSTAPPYSIACAASGAALATVDRRQFQTDVPCDYAWDAGDMDEIAYKITPIDARLYTSITVRFDYMARGNYNASRNPQVTDYYQVVYSLNNGATWIAVNAGNNTGSYTLRNALNTTTNGFFSTTAGAVTGTVNVTMPTAVTGTYFLLGFRWTNDGNQAGDNVDNMMIDNIVILGSPDYSWSPTSGVTNSNTATPTVTQPGTYTVTVTAGNGCSSTDQVVVSPRADITNMTASTCSGAAFAVSPLTGTNGVVPLGTTYSWSAPSVAGITGAALGTNASNISGTVTNTTNAPINVVYSITPTANGCVSPSFTLTMTVNPTPAVTAMTATACSGSVFNVAPVNGTNGVVPSGITYSWLAPVVSGGLGGGAAGSASSGIAGNLTNPTSVTHTAVYTVTPSIPGCSGSNFTVSVTVDPPVTLPTTITYTVVEPICQLTSSATTDYNSTATVGTLEWSLTNISNTNGTLLASAINSTTGVVTWPANWSGGVTINVRSTGCGTSGFVTRTVTLGPASINPGHRTWTGLALDQLWQNNGNWDCGGVPTSADDVIIPEFPIAGNNETPRIENGIIGYCKTIEIQGNTANRIGIQTGGILSVIP